MAHILYIMYINNDVGIPYWYIPAVLYGGGG